MTNRILSSLRQGAIGTLILSLVFISLEPAIGYATVSASSQFTVSQTVTSEISFATTASNVIMKTAGGATSIGGITGGTTYGATSVAVRTNNLTGYNMTIQASSSLGMQGTASTTNYIPAYVTGTPGVPDYSFSAETNSAGFGYTVNASSTGDVVQLFRNSSSACNSAIGTPDGSHCWIAATSTALEIINRSLPTPNTGATTTLNFQVTIGSSPSPMIPNDTYVATTTLTATTN